MRRPSPRYKPTLGFPRHLDAVVALRDAGCDPDQIAAAAGTSRNSVNTALRRLREDRPAARQRTVVLSTDVLDRLAPHAARRGLHVNDLVRRIVDQVAEDGIVDAVLDDA